MNIIISVKGKVSGFWICLSVQLNPPFGLKEQPFYIIDSDLSWTNHSIMDV